MDRSRDLERSHGSKALGASSKWSPAIALLYVLILAGYPVTAVLRVYLGLDPNDKFVSYLLRSFIAVIAIYLITTKRIDRQLSLSPLIVFWGLYVLRIFVDTILFPYVDDMPVNYMVYAIGNTLLPAVAFLIPPDPRSLRIALYGNVALLLVACLTTLFIPESQKFLTHGGRTGLDTLNPISLGHAGASLALLSAYLLLVRPPGSKLVYALLLGPLAVGVYTVLAAGSRGPALALGATLLILVGVVIKNLRWQAGTTLVVGGVVLAGVAVALVIQLDVSKVAEIGRKMIIGRLENDASSIDSNYRTTLVLSAIQQFADEPFLGSSLVEKNSGEYPHNLIVESFMATGVVGGIMFVAVLVIGLNSAVRILRFQPTAIWVALIFIQNVIGAQFSGSLWGSYQFWCFALAMLALGRIKTLGQVSGAVANHGIDADRLRTFPGRLAPILPRVGPAR